MGRRAGDWWMAFERGAHSANVGCATLVRSGNSSTGDVQPLTVRCWKVEGARGGIELLLLFILGAFFFEPTLARSGRVASAQPRGGGAIAGAAREEGRTSVDPKRLNQRSFRERTAQTEERSPACRSGPGWFVA